MKIARSGGPSEGVALDGHVHHADRLAVQGGNIGGEEDGAGAGAPGREAAADSLTEWLKHVEGDEEAGDRRALAAGDHEPVDGVDLSKRTHLDRIDP